MKKRIKHTTYEVRDPRGIIVEWGHTPEQAISSAVKIIKDIKILEDCKLCEVIHEEIYVNNNITHRLHYVNKVYPINVEHITF